MQKFIGKLGGDVEVSASVVRQVDDELFHSLFLQLRHSIHILFVGTACKAAQADVARFVISHVGGIDAVEGDVVAGDAEFDGLRRAAAFYRHVHLRSLRSSEALHNVGVAHFLPGNQRVVDGNDAVAGNDSHALRRAASNRLDDVERVFLHVELYAYAAEVAVEWFGQFLCLFLVGVSRVWVELFKHALDGVFNELVFVDGVHIVVVDGVFGKAQLGLRRHGLLL